SVAIRAGARQYPLLVCRREVDIATVNDRCTQLIDIIGKQHVVALLGKRLLKLRNLERMCLEHELVVFGGRSEPEAGPVDHHLVDPERRSFVEGRTVLTGGAPTVRSGKVADLREVVLICDMEHRMESFDLARRRRPLGKLGAGAVLIEVAGTHPKRLAFHRASPLMQRQHSPGIGALVPAGYVRQRPVVRLNEPFLRRSRSNASGKAPGISRGTES